MFVGTVKYCDFEKGFCDWKNNGDKFKRLSAGTPSRGTGPSADHTSGTGNLITDQREPRCFLYNLKRL